VFRQQRSVAFSDLNIRKPLKNIKLMNRIALAVIIFYQKYISPFKGFTCAYRAATGQLSCSAYGHKVIEQYGIILGLKLIGRRVKQCGLKYRQHVSVRQQEQNGLITMRRQAGHCDADFGDCTCDATDLASCACDGIGNCDFGSGIGWRRKKEAQENGEKRIKV